MKKTHVAGPRTRYDSEFGCLRRQNHGNVT